MCFDFFLLFLSLFLLINSIINNNMFILYPTHVSLFPKMSNKHQMNLTAVPVLKWHRGWIWDFRNRPVPEFVGATKPLTNRRI